MQQFDILILGGGAAGLCAAVRCKRNNPALRVAVLEHLPRGGKKLLATGNGRCNLSNRNAAQHAYHNRAFAAHALHTYSVPQVLDFFASLGILAREEEGRLYPVSNTAASVLDALRYGAVCAGVQLLCDVRIQSVNKQGEQFVLDNAYSAPVLLFATGGRAAPVHGSDGSGYTLLAQLGHPVTAQTPALVQLETDTRETRRLKGLRIHDAQIELLCGEKPLAQARGELLFTDYGISGIAAMEVSRHAALCAGQAAAVRLHLAPWSTQADILHYLQAHCAKNPSLPGEMLLDAYIPRAVGRAVCKAAGEPPHETLAHYRCGALERIAAQLCAWSIPVTGTRGFAAAQVTAGGADVQAFDPQTMQSRLHSGLYCAGEVLDVDGGCGGYNLHWAWVSALLAADSMTR